MNPRDYDHPAFPRNDMVNPNGDIWPGHSGMSMRDYIAVAAMRALLSSPNTLSTNFIVATAYQMADAMLIAGVKQ